MKITRKHILKKISDKLHEYNTWLVLTHQKPDGDTLGSASALAQFGINAGKRVFWGGADTFPNTYEFLPLSDQYVQLSHVSELGITEPYVAIILDTSNIERSVPGLTENIQGTPATVINIDHHGDNELFGQITHVDPGSSAVGEILWWFFKQNGHPITRGMAEALYTAIVTDCGHFSYSNTSETTHLAAADLLSLGVDPSKMDQLIFKNQGLQALNLWGRAFSRARNTGNSCISSWLEEKDFKETGADHADTENLVSKLLFLKNIDFAVLFVQEEGQIRVSLRSCGNISARDIAQRFGGGGHIPAAGCKLKEDLNTAKDRVLEEISKEYALRNNCTE